MTDAMDFEPIYQQLFTPYTDVLQQKLLADSPCFRPDDPGPTDWSDELSGSNFLQLASIILLTTLAVSFLAAMCYVSMGAILAVAAPLCITSLGLGFVGVVLTIGEWLDRPSLESAAVATTESKKPLTNIPEKRPTDTATRTTLENPRSRKMSWQACLFRHKPQHNRNTSKESIEMATIGTINS
jgi:hypothetical protein